MKIRQIKFQNIASYGKEMQQIDFDPEKGNFYLLMGGNGEGKSTVSNVIKLGLYGKTGTKIKKSEVANRMNGDGYISVTIESHGKLVEIERWFSPSKDPRVIIDGIEQSANMQAGKKNIENYIENELLEFPFHVFNNILTLSVNDFKSLLKMSPSDKKAIFDRIFGFYILNEMNKIITQKIKQEKRDVEGFLHEIQATTENLEGVKQKIKAVEESLQQENEKKTSELSEKVSELTESLKSLDKTRDTLSEMDSESRKNIRELERTQSEYNSEINNIKKQLRLYENDQCPTCGSALDSDEHLSAKASLEAELEKHIGERKKTQENITDLEQKADELRKELRGLDSKINETKSTVRDIERELNALSKGDKSESTEHLEEVVEELHQTIDAKKKKKKQSEIRHSYLKQVADVIGETGVKAEMMRSILPALNNEIATYCETLNLPYTIQFDETFDSHIYSLGYDISPKTLSTGEMKKADFVCLIAVIKLMKLKYPSINLMFLDEIFSSLDMGAVNSVLYILKDLVREYGLNVFVINHSPLPVNVFDYVLTAEKTGGFSNLTVNSN